MIRSLAFFLFGAILVIVFCVPSFLMQSDQIILGGHYNVSPGATVNKDIRCFFTQVTIDEGAAVDGYIFLYSSTLDLRGRITQDIHAYESDLNLRETAQVDGEISEKEFTHWTLLLPAAVRLP